MPRPPVDPQWLRGPADIEAIRQGCYFDADAGQFACDFIETFCCPSEGPGAGKPLVLLPWQRDFVMRLFGWKRPNGLRRYKRAYLEIAKKNGKSMLLSAIVLLLLMADGEASPKVYLNACDREQAGIVFGESAKMIESSPALKGRLTIYNTKENKRILCPANNGVVIANSSVAASKDGLNPHGIIFDEVHRQADRRLFDVFEHASAAREQPLWIDITTAGEDETGVWHEQREYSERNNRGDIDPPDITHLGVVYRAFEEDDLDSPETWRKANPSLGHVLKEEEFREKLAQAKETPAKLANFKRLRLNIIQREAAHFLRPESWSACGPVPPAKAQRFPAEGVKGLPCYAGADLSEKIDLTTLVAIFGSFDRGFQVSCWAYLPADTIVAAEKRDRVPYRAWADAGWITLTDGPVVDYGFIREEGKRLHREHYLRMLAVDPHKATHLLQLWQEHDGITVSELQQGFISLSEPTKELEKLVLSGKLRHDGNPLLKWCILNAVPEKDAAGNIKLSKRKSRQKIDAAAALVNAIAAAMAGNGSGRSVYETRGLITL